MKLFATEKFQIQYDSWGDEQGRPILFFHGFPGSHVQAKALEPVLKKHKVFLLAADRPGYGGTVGEAGPEAYLQALHALLRHHQIQKFDIIGVSGGAPWAHLMASLFAEDVRSLQIICGLGTCSRETQPYFSKLQGRVLRASRYIPRLVLDVLLKSLLKRSEPEQSLERLLQFLDSTDREILGAAANRKMIVQSMKHARAQGGKGIHGDAALYRRDWLRQDCDPARLRKIPTFYYHGVRDRVVNPGFSEWMHRANPASQLKIFADEGHYSLPFRKAELILGELSKT